jgi:hypothetical protein
VVKRFALSLLLAACGDNLGPLAPPPPDAAPDAAVQTPLGCRASYAGNFTETDTTFSPCGMLDGSGAVAFAVPATALGTDVAIAIQLAAPAAGTYTSETVPAWSAEASIDFGGPMCIYTAGNAEAPNGYFTLTLDTVDASTGVIHGALSLLMYVLVPPFSPCGSDTTETLDVTF